MIKKIALIGNPNVGKSTIFNTLTGKNEHTGNWPGKTVGNVISKYNYKSNEYIIYDLPGVYSLVPHSKEEEIALNFIESDYYDVALIVCDACLLERNLNLVLQTKEITDNIIIVVNLMDEAKKKNINIDFNELSNILDAPTIGVCARNNMGIKTLLEIIESFKKRNKKKIKKKSVEEINKLSTEIANKVVTFNNENYNKKDKKIDKLLTNKFSGILIMLMSLLIIFWITIVGANYPSNFLFNLFEKGENLLFILFNKLNFNKTFSDIFINGIYKTTTWVISVMLPPMLIFFPIFAVLEDYGLLPRIAFNMDKLFNKCNSCGKQALTMCMGFGCNAIGVTSSRIIDSKRERLIAIITNSFVPCNGRFPTIIAIISMFFVCFKNSRFNSILSSLILTLIILVSVFITFIVSKILSKTLVKGIPSSFTLELPAYRKPKFLKVITLTIREKVLRILLRAICVALPAGLIIWLLSNIYISDISILKHLIIFLDPIARIFGMDGTILLSFILGFPANEIVIPIMLMGYLNNSVMSDYNNLNELKEILINNGWTLKTAICTIIFSLIHFPCSTTCLTIKKETKSFKWTILSILLPTFIGLLICFLVSHII